MTALQGEPPQCTASADHIESVEAVTVVLSIPRPLRLGPSSITRRLYTVVRVETADGLVGEAYALSRDAPVTATLNEQLAPLVIGRPADAISSIWDLVYRSTLAA